MRTETITCLDALSACQGKPMKAELVPENGNPPIPITRDVTVIGRREFCDVVIDDVSLSKRHCVLVKTDGLVIEKRQNLSEQQVPFAKPGPDLKDLCQIVEVQQR